MTKIEYPKEGIALKAKSNKKTETKKSNTQLVELKYQVDELETKSRQTEIVHDDTSLQLANLQQAIANQQNQIDAHASSILNLAETKQNTLTFDATPTNASTNPATSGGIFSALSGKQDVLTAGNGITMSGTTICADTNTLATKTDLSSKQDNLTAGANITIAQNVISANAGLTEVFATDVDSQGASNGQVLTADGNGGASWQNVNSADISNLQTQISNNYNAISNLNAIKQNVLTFDFTPTQNSNHVVTSGGVYDAIQNVAGGGLSEVTASDVDSETATSGQVLTADGEGGASWQTPASGGGSAACNCTTDIASLQSDIANINAKLLVMETKIKNNEVVYNETIYNEYDVYERDLDLSGTDSVNSPVVLFATQDMLTSTDQNDDITTYQINISSQITVQLQTNTAGDYIIETYEDNVLVNTKNVTFNVNELNTLKTITYKVQSFTSSSDHNYYIKFATGNVATYNASVAMYGLKIEIVAPNVTILNKIHPYDVQFCYYTNKYYISDCTSGFAKLAEIDANNLHSTSDIIWTQTNIPAQNFKTYFIGATDNTSTTIGKKYAIVTNKNDTISILDMDENQIIYTTARGCYKMSQIFTKHNYSVLFKNMVLPTSYEARLIFLSQAGAITSNYYFNYENTVVSIEGIRNNLDYLSGSASWSGNFTTKRNGELLYYTTNSYNISTNELFVEDAKLYMKKVTNSSNFDYDCFIKQFGKYYHFTGNYISRFTATSQKTLLGEYDDLFFGANNDYFVVNNKVLSYKTILD